MGSADEVRNLHAFITDDNEWVVKFFLSKLVGEEPEIPEKQEFFQKLSSATKKDKKYPIDLFMYITGAYRGNYRSTYEDLEYISLLDKAFNEGSDIYAIVSLMALPEEDTPSYVFRAAGLLILATRADIDPHIKFWIALWLMRFQCQGVFGDAETTSIITRASLILFGQLPFFMSLRARFFMDCVILTRPEWELYNNIIMYGHSSAETAGKVQLVLPSKASEYLALFKDIYKRLNEDYEAQVHFASAKYIISDTTGVMIKALKDAGVVTSETAKVIAQHPLTKKGAEVSLDYSVYIAKAVLNAALTGLKFSASATATSAPIIGAGLSTGLLFAAKASTKFAGKITGAMVHHALGILASTGEFVMKPILRQPRLGQATMHTTLPIIDHIMECSDKDIPVTDLPPDLQRVIQEHPEQVAQMTSIATMTDEDLEALGRCAVPDTQKIRNEIEANVQNTPIQLASPCPPCPPPIEKVVYRDKIVYKDGPERIVYRDRIVPGQDIIVYKQATCPDCPPCPSVVSSYVAPSPPVSIATYSPPASITNKTSRRGTRKGRKSVRKRATTRRKSTRTRKQSTKRRR